MDPVTKAKSISCVGELLQLIPEDWREADLMMSSRLHDLTPVMRVGLHENGDGRRVVVIYEEPIAINA